MSLARTFIDDASKINPLAKLTVEKLSYISSLTAPQKDYLQANGDAALVLLQGTMIGVGQSIFRTEDDVVVNASNLDSGAFQNGKDYYVYACEPAAGNVADIVISLNATYPIGKSPDNSRKIGGFHYGSCRRVSDTLTPINTSEIERGTGWEDNIYFGIKPFSVWTLLHRPVCEPEGMAYVKALGLWVDIYITSTNFLSEYGVVPITGTEGLSYYDYMEKLSRITGKRPLSMSEFWHAADGSPNGQDGNNNYAWSATTNTARNPCGLIDKAVSIYGLMDCSGNVWEISGNDFSWTTQNWGSTVSPTVGPWQFRNATEVVKGAIHAVIDNDLRMALNGGAWNDGASCGSRCAALANMPWSVNAHVGFRGAAVSL
ncbi:MAG: SUMF1/EgtB/PvdO family nonheme iron enzyme [Fusobacteriaceae bacterium]|jgi:hypothetical protein|nr:SUMF1/EgtB/PvdO family nonheme iron enzyme [Fusobacteriaceae bacterium]